MRVNFYNLFFYENRNKYIYLYMKKGSWTVTSKEDLSKTTSREKYPVFKESNMATFNQQLR